MKITRNRVLGGAAGVITAAITAVVMLTTGDSLQSAVNAANCGDTIVLEASRTYVENITLPVKPCTDSSYITIQSSRASELPEGKRVGPAQSALFAKLQSSTNAGQVIKAAPGAHHYKFIGLEISTTSESITVFDLVRFGGSRHDQKTLESVPHHLIIDRSYLHGWPTQDVQRGVSLNCANCEVTNSYVSDIHAVGVEAQAVGAWNGPGPLRIINNYLEAAGENVMIGGADSAIPELMPGGVEIRNNYMFKPLSWKVGHPTFVPIMRTENGVLKEKHWTVKNILELKVANGAVIDGNVFENNWVDAQDGSAILMTVRNQECTAPWGTIRNITFTNNTVKNADGAGIQLLGRDNESTPEYLAANPGKCGNLPPTEVKLGSMRGTGAVINNNLFYDIRGAFLQLNGFYNVTAEQNTHFQAANTITLYGEPSQEFVYRRNVTIERQYGVFGDGGLIGKAALDHWTPGYVFTLNVMGHPPLAESWYVPMPTGNEFPPAVSVTSEFRTPFTDRGANIDQLLAAQGGVGSSPLPSPTSQPSISPSPSATATVALPSPTATATLAPSPSPVSSPRPSPLPTATPCPSPGQVALCRSGQFVGNPPQCLCRSGMRGDRCK